MRRRWLPVGLVAVLPVLLLTPSGFAMVTRAADAAVIPVTLTGSGATSTSAAVSVRNGVVTLAQAATYRISGRLDGGQLVVDVSGEGAVGLILDGVDITTDAVAALEVADADQVDISLVSGTESTFASSAIVDAAPTADGQPDGVVYSTADLTIAGPGALQVSAASGDGIVGKDSLVIDSGAISVTAADDGIRGKDSLVINGGSIAVEAGGDGFSTTESGTDGEGNLEINGGTLQVSAVGDGIQAAADVGIHGGDLSVVSGGGAGQPRAEKPDGTLASSKGIRSDGSTLIDGGTVNIDSADDSVNASFDIAFDGGEVIMESGDDAAHADKTLTVSSGSVTVNGSFEALNATQVDIAGGSVDVTASNDGIGASEKGANDVAASKNASIVISGGDVVVHSGDDSIDSNGSITISGGTLAVYPKYDGLDSNGAMNINGGVVVINGNEVSNEGQDGIECFGTLAIKGGTLISAGALAAYRTPPANMPQAWVYGKFSKQLPVDTVVQLVSGDGEVIMSYRSRRTMQQLMFTSDAIAAGDTYEVYVGGDTAGEPVDSLYPSGDLDGAVSYGTLSANKYSATALLAPRS